MPHPTSRARRFPTANVTTLPGGATNPAAGGLVAQRSPVLPAPRFPRTGGPPQRSTGLGGELSVQPPLALPELGQFRAIQAPNVPQAASFASGDARIQDLIAQIARSTQSGATTGGVFQPGPGFREDPRLRGFRSFQPGAEFHSDPRIAQLVQLLSNPSAVPGFQDTGTQQRAMLEALVTQLSSGRFNFDAATDPEARAFRVARERARTEAQVGISERRAADPTNTGGFDVDTRALREQTGESVARFSAGRASQRRSEVLAERTGGVNAALANLGQIQTGDVARFNAGLASRGQGIQQQLASLQAALSADTTRLGAFRSQRQSAQRAFETQQRGVFRQDAERRASFESQRGREQQAFQNAQVQRSAQTQFRGSRQQALLQSLLAEQARVQGGQAAAGQQVFENQLSSRQFERGQGSDARRAQQEQLARTVQQQETQQQLRRDALAEQQARQDEEFRRREEERTAQGRRDQRRREQATELERQRQQVHQQHGHDHG